jgi:hypothetical protein
MTLLMMIDQITASPFSVGAAKRGLGLGVTGDATARYATL